MRILVLGGDGYLGWPTAMSFAAKGHDVDVVDNYLRRRLAVETSSEALIDTPDLHQRAEVYRAHSNHDIGVHIFDVTDYGKLAALFAELQPEVVSHYAEQPAAPYGMVDYDEARLTLSNNLLSTLNVIWAVMEHAPDCPIVKIGTMGEYGTPNIDIEEGWLEVEHNGRKQKFLYPRQAGSLYHTTKVLDTDLLWFYVRTFGVRVTDLMQGPVYGLSTPEAALDDALLPNFHYDDIFGTVLNRFLVQAVAGIPLTVYGKGEQSRGFLDLRDTIQCVELSIMNPPERGELRVMNQFVDTFSVNQLAEWVQRVGNGIGLAVKIDHIENPREELEDHYYNPKHSALLDLGLEPHRLSDEVIEGMLRKIMQYRERIDTSKMLPRRRWKAGLRPPK
ncbi:MAG: NAD-dependent epimerase/dehydratase family protein [Deltaproteobacteria bacterium]|jgi:UDP-sulfoquinovose synthase|nr:NAD-dependent epimerase/dehydratase family protein [Deltaproteobacteria bacterium]MBW2537435.1 NAD-dependent epimerase/dehydratase family protein [Deltaproteobacteria bacterium]